MSLGIAWHHACPSQRLTPARARSWDLDGAPPHSDTGVFQDVSLENQRSLAEPALSVCVLHINGGAWAMSRCEIAGAGTGFQCEALVILGGELVAQPANSSLRECNSPVLSLRHCCVRVLRPDEIEVWLPCVYVCMCMGVCMLACMHVCMVHRYARAYAHTHLLARIHVCAGEVVKGRGGEREIKMW